MPHRTLEDLFGEQAARGGKVGAALAPRRGSKLERVQGRQKRNRRRKLRQMETLSTLFSKTIQSREGATSLVGEDVVQFAQLPRNVRDKIAETLGGQPPLGFDLTQLTGPEKFQLKRLMFQGARERDVLRKQKREFVGPPAP